MPPRPTPFLSAILAALLLTTGCAASGTPATVAAAGATDSGVPALDPVSAPEWAGDMARFAAEDAASPPPAHPVVFTGSSSVRLWTTLAEDFPDQPVLNRGFGGSHVRDAVHYADEVAIRYRPGRILIYAGDNDTMDGRSPQQVLADFQAFVARVHHDLPGTPIAFIAIKPSPSRAHLLQVQRASNALVRDWAARTPDVDYIDVFTPMLGADGQPRPELFTEDALHMNAQGYALWRDIIAPYLR
ncbi:SGNH/GDSL hydrolase family protein [Luteimonas suaedae]|uniref:SGNH/GDSL hydrolase family protein n=1 Tax=Luteimonas suaedae TaxID=2605430 RepID=UPI0011EE9520|nr:SGNH/GDSL hydrolase family protein [Luteimonas suaedae]